VVLCWVVSGDSSAGGSLLGLQLHHLQEMITHQCELCACLQVYAYQLMFHGTGKERQAETDVLLQ
jgi:hypothetical protein